MQRTRKNIPDENEQADKSLGFTEAELFAELDGLFKVEEMQPGDVTIRQLEDRYGISHQSVRRKMRSEIDAGRWIQLEAIVNGHRSVIYRRVR